MAKRCICGGSDIFPLCDGSHKSRGWSCKLAPDCRVGWCFVAGPDYENLAERLAHKFGGVAAHAVADPVRAERLVVLTEGTDLDVVKQMAQRVEAVEVQVVAVNVDAALLVAAFMGPDFLGYTVIAVQADALGLWEAVCRTLDAPPASPAAESVELVSCFVSHGVADERSLAAPLDYVRKHYGADLFLCADSIKSGGVWQSEIVTQLRARPRFLLFVSKASMTSTFCAFEVGYALALGKQLTLISLDGSTPPSYVQHLHMVDPMRTRASKPWLSLQQALIDALLQVLTP